MKSSEIVAQMQNLLSARTNAFTDQVPCTLAWLNLEITGTTVKPHRLRTGDDVVITGSEVPIKYTGSRTQDAGSTDGLVVTDFNHDLTEGILALNAAGKIVVTLSGADEDQWNGTFVVRNIDNRRTLLITMNEAWTGAEDAAPTGTPVLDNALGEYRGLNRAFTVRETTELTFKLQHPFVGLGAGEAPPAGAILVHGTPRVSAAATLERAIASYTSQELADLWAFVVLGDVVASKGREFDSDGIDQQITDDSFRQQIIQPFSILVFIPSSDSIGGAEPKDTAQDLLLPLCQAVLGTKFDSGLSNAQQGSVQFGGHAQFQYDGPLYVHEFVFQQTVDLLFADTVGPSVDVAFRNIDLSIFPALSLDDTVTTLIGESALDLDDVQL